MCVEILSVKNRSTDLINYTIPYMVSLFGIDLSKTENAIAISIFLLIMLLLTISTKLVFLNPVLALAGYNLYDLEYRFDGKNYSTIVISKHDMHISERVYIRSLTQYLYFLTKEEEDEN